MMQHQRIEMGVSRRQRQRALIVRCSPGERDRKVREFEADGFRMISCEPHTCQDGRRGLELVFVAGTRQAIEFR
jgi:hypothetical protein